MAQTEPSSIEAYGPVGTNSQRLLTIGGILLIASGMLFGDIFAMFVLHPNNARIGEAMYAASQLIPAGDADCILAHFMAIGGFLENRGTKVDTHSHIIHMGYIALLLAMLQPWVALSESVKRRTAGLFIASSFLMPVSIFAIYYIGLAYSPFEHIGWASISADFFGAVLALIMAIQLWGLWRHRRGQGDKVQAGNLHSDNGAARVLLVGGLLLLVSGFLYGAGYAAWTQFGGAVSEVEILKNIVTHAAASEQELLDADFGAFGNYQMYRAINVAVHTHINEMGILMLLMSFVQGFIHYSETTRKRWANGAVVSGFGLPIGILLEINFGIVGSIIADFFGFTMIVCLMAMLFGLLRYTGARDSEKGDAA